jgi:hypothetical protein
VYWIFDCFGHPGSVFRALLIYFLIRTLAIISSDFYIPKFLETKKKFEKIIKKLQPPPSKVKEIEIFEPPPWKEQKIENFQPPPRKPDKFIATATETEKKIMFFSRRRGKHRLIPLNM